MSEGSQEDYPAPAPAVQARAREAQSGGRWLLATGLCSHRPPVDHRLEVVVVEVALQVDNLPEVEVIIDADHFVTNRTREVVFTLCCGCRCRRHGRAPRGHLASGCRGRGGLRTGLARIPACPER